MWQRPEYYRVLSLTYLRLDPEDRESPTLSDPKQQNLFATIIAELYSFLGDSALEVTSKTEESVFDLSYYRQFYTLEHNIKMESLCVLKQDKPRAFVCSICSQASPVQDTYDFLEQFVNNIISENT